MWEAVACSNCGLFGDGLVPYRLRDEDFQCPGCFEFALHRRLAPTGGLGGRFKDLPVQQRATQPDSLPVPSASGGINISAAEGLPAGTAAWEIDALRCNFGSMTVHGFDVMFRGKAKDCVFQGPYKHYPSQPAA